jgi:hypothetical protein
MLRLSVTSKPIMLSVTSKPIMLSVTNKVIMLSVIMLNAIMLSVVAPFESHCLCLPVRGKAFITKLFLKQ